FAGGQEVAEAGVLRDHWFAGCEITGAAITEPAGTRDHISAFCDSELGPRLLNKLLVVLRRAGNAFGIDELPTLVSKGVEIFAFVRMNVHGQREAGIRLLRQ